MTVSLDLYQRILESRPLKLSAEEVDYRPGDKEHACSGCVHLFTRQVDSFHTCEIFRPEDDDTVIANYVCSFWSDDNENHPLLEE